MCHELRSSLLWPSEGALTWVLTFIHYISHQPSPRTNYLPAVAHSLDYIRTHVSHSQLWSLVLPWCTILSVIILSDWLPVADSVVYRLRTSAACPWPVLCILISECYLPALTIACYLSTILPALYHTCLLLIYPACTTTLLFNKACKWIPADVTIHYNMSVQERAFKIHCKASLGELLSVEIYSKPFMGLLYNQWFCDKILIKTPEGDEILFPCYSWLDSNERLILRPAKGRQFQFRSWAKFSFTSVLETHTHRFVLLSNVFFILYTLYILSPYTTPKPTLHRKLSAFLIKHCSVCF